MRISLHICISLHFSSFLCISLHFSAFLWICLHLSEFLWFLYISLHFTCYLLTERTVVPWTPFFLFPQGNRFWAPIGRPAFPTVLWLVPLVHVTWVELDGTKLSGEVGSGNHCPLFQYLVKRLTGWYFTLQQKISIFAWIGENAFRKVLQDNNAISLDISNVFDSRPRKCATKKHFSTNPQLEMISRCPTNLMQIKKSIFRTKAMMMMMIVWHQFCMRAISIISRTVCWSWWILPRW